MVERVNLKKMLDEATEDFTTGFMCSETVIDVLNRNYDLGMSDDAIAMSTGFPYGFGNGGNVCGAVAGATMALGKVFGRKEKGASTTQILQLVRELNEDVAKKYGSSICPEIIKEYKFADPDRKTHCTGLVHEVIRSFARIMERECNVAIEREV